VEEGNKETQIENQKGEALVERISVLNSSAEKRRRDGV